MSIAEANKQYFDLISDSYDSKPWFAKVNQQVTDTLRSRLDWIGIPFANLDSASHDREVKLLDYACGTGIMSRIFGPYVTITRGVDVSPNMVATYNARARAADFPSSQITAVVGDMLSKGQPPDQEIAGLEFYNFDLAAVGFAFHHFEDVLYAAERLQERLKPGGVLVFSDFVQGADLLVDESGNPIEGSEGDHAAHDHGHHHHHGEHNHGHGHANEQRHHQNHHDHPTKGDTEPRQPLEDPLKDPETHTKMRKSIVFENFTVDGVKEFLTAAGFVDVDAVVMEDRVYMEFAGKKMWRKILFGKGKRPLEGKSEL